MALIGSRRTLVLPPRRIGDRDGEEPTMASRAVAWRRKREPDRVAVALLRWTRRDSPGRLQGRCRIHGVAALCSRLRRASGLRQTGRSRGRHSAFALVETRIHGRATLSSVAGCGSSLCSHSRTIPATTALGRLAKRWPPPARAEPRLVPPVVTGTVSDYRAARPARHRAARARPVVPARGSRGDPHCRLRTCAASKGTRRAGTMGVRRPRLRAQSLESRACVFVVAIRVDHIASGSRVQPPGSALFVRLAQARLVSRLEGVRFDSSCSTRLRPGIGTKAHR